MRVLDLFSGIGGFSLGLERAGMTTVAFCEVNPYARRVLAKHWPSVPCYGDIRELTAAQLGADGISVDVICGGFPCQDISVAGKGAGLAGERSGLWSEYARLIGELRPAHVIVENVSALLGRGLGTVLGDLAALGYDAEWDCIPASDIGAPHRRDRIWIIAHADSNNGRPWRARGLDTGRAGQLQPERSFQDVDDTICGRYRASLAEIRAGRNCPVNASWWSSEPNVGRVAHGVPSRVDRLRCLGNAVVPQIPELIGRAIMRASEGAAP
jgi:DNA (cytosine-5)-methyltransferase 1